MSGKALIKNLKHCRDLTDQGYNIVLTFPHSTPELPKHIIKLIELHDIFDVLSYQENVFGGVAGYKLSNGKYLGFKGENNSYFELKNNCHLPLNILHKNTIIYVRYDFDPDLHLANQILDS